MVRDSTFPAAPAHRITRHHQVHEEEVMLKKQNQKPLRQHPGMLSLGRSRSRFSMDTWTRAITLSSPIQQEHHSRQAVVQTHCFQKQAVVQIHCF